MSQEQICLIMAKCRMDFKQCIMHLHFTSNATMRCFHFSCDLAGNGVSQEQVCLIDNQTFEMLNVAFYSCNLSPVAACSVL